jgi:hypothetical protein
MVAYEDFIENGHVLSRSQKRIHRIPPVFRAYHNRIARAYGDIQHFLDQVAKLDTGMTARLQELHNKVNRDYNRVVRELQASRSRAEALISTNQKALQRHLLDFQQHTWKGVANRVTETNERMFVLERWANSMDAYKETIQRRHEDDIQDLARVTQEHSQRLDHVYSAGLVTAPHLVRILSDVTASIMTQTKADISQAVAEAMAAQDLTYQGIISLVASRRGSMTVKSRSSGSTRGVLAPVAASDPVLRTPQTPASRTKSLNVPRTGVLVSASSMNWRSDGPGTSIQKPHHSRTLLKIAETLTRDSLHLSEETDQPLHADPHEGPRG